MSSDAPSIAERAWDEAALGYDAYFGPRFAPYLGALLGALVARAGDLPDGAIVVPCAGPGRELGPLSRAFPERLIAASDLSSEMVRLAQARNARAGNVFVSRGDASTLKSPACGVAAVYSTFGLQLLPEPPTTLASWVSLLKPDGLAAVLYWPREGEASGPYRSMHQLLARVGLRDAHWEQALVPTLDALGARVLVDHQVSFEMQHDSAAAVWKAFTRTGPLRGLALSRGQQFVDQLGAEFERALPRGPLTHAPPARLLLVQS